MVVYLSDGERGGERHFVGKAEAETGEGNAPFPRLGVATVHLAVASHASPAAWQLAAAEEEGWIMTLQTALAPSSSRLIRRVKSASGIRKRSSARRFCISSAPSTVHSLILWYH